MEEIKRSDFILSICKKFNLGLNLDKDDNVVLLDLQPCNHVRGSIIFIKNKAYNECKLCHKLF